MSNLLRYWEAILFFFSDGRCILCINLRIAKLGVLKTMETLVSHGYTNLRICYDMETICA
jgi:hypothetical protein